jgi:hypothetical protein
MSGVRTKIRSYLFSQNTKCWRRSTRRGTSSSIPDGSRGCWRWFGTTIERPLGQRTDLIELKTLVGDHLIVVFKEEFFVFERISYFQALFDSLDQVVATIDLRHESFMGVRQFLLNQLDLRDLVAGARPRRRGARFKLVVERYGQFTHGLILFNNRQ